MLCGQRGFFLSSTQYEAVILEFFNTRNGAVTYKFSKIEEVDRFAIYTRISTDAAQTWQEWQRQDLTLTTNPATFTIQYSQGIICEAYVVVIGDGTREQSDPSNIVTTIVPREPAVSPPVVYSAPFYYNGRPVPVLYHKAVPTGISAWVAWYREFGDPDWIQIGATFNTATSIVNKEELLNGHTYQFITAWVSNDAQYILSDISNITTLTLPPANINYLLPPIINYIQFENIDGKYYNMVSVIRGDMRATSIAERARSTTHPAWKYWDAQPLEDLTKPNYTLGFGYTNNAPVTGEEFWYQVKNLADGYTESEFSNEASIVVPSLLPKLETPVIRFNQSGNNVIISWDSVDYATGYKLERKLTEDSDFTLVSDSIPSSWTSYEDNATRYGNTYVYRLTALGDYTIYQDSLPAEDYITVEQTVVIPAPVISNLALNSNGFDVDMTISNLDGAHSRTTYIELSEDNGTWTRVGYANVESVAVTSVNVTIPTEKILHGGVLRFRAYQYGGGTYEDSDYSNIESITIAHRVWLLRWTGTTWDYCTSVTGGWSSPNITFSDGVVAGNVTAVNQGDGTLRLQGSGYYMTGAMTSGNAAMSTTYSKIVMIGTLVKESDGTDYHAWFGNNHTYNFSGGTCIERSNYVFAGSESGRAAHGSRTNPQVNAVGQGTYGAQNTGARVYFRFASGHADIRGIFATLRN